MNIFLLHQDPWKAASYLHDKHVVKMGLEAAQIASTALYLANPKLYHQNIDRLYKPTHTSHPWVVWAAQSYGHIDSVRVWGSAILQEYTHRYNRVHASESVLDTLNIILVPVTREIILVHEAAPPLCMPSHYQEDNDPILSYRRYYAIEKCNNNPKWTNRKPPLWVDSEEE